MRTVLALGAEAQAATSLALAYPERSVIFVSDRDILDGSDLPNVCMALARPSEAHRFAGSADHVVPLCPRWLQTGAGSSMAHDAAKRNPPRNTVHAPAHSTQHDTIEKSVPAFSDYALSVVFARLGSVLPELVLPVQAAPGRGRWIVKGDRWHRPDNPVAGDARQLADVADAHGCGIVYQPWYESQATIMTIGRRYGPGAVALGAVHVFDERFFRDVVLQAGETVSSPEIVQATLAVLDALDHRGFFTLNWLRGGDGLRLSSFRPVPRAVFQAFRRSGLDLLDPVSAIRTAAPGIRFIARPHYVSFERLRA